MRCRISNRERLCRTRHLLRYPKLEEMLPLPINVTKKCGNKHAELLCLPGTVRRDFVRKPGLRKILTTVCESPEKQFAKERKFSGKKNKMSDDRTTHPTIIVLQTYLL